MYLLKKRKIDTFRFNLDLFNSYQFKWINDSFEIKDPLGRCFYSKNLSKAIFYKGLFAIDEPTEFDHLYEDPKWIKSWINNVYFSLARFAFEKNKVKLWLPQESYLTKTYQMECAKDFFQVPNFAIHWGFEAPAKEVISKPLTARKFGDNCALYARKIDRNLLDPNYPWFTQDIAEGNRDATVLYINGKVHSYQFKSKREDFTDWRITQGTKANKWIKWKSGKDFENRVDNFMKKIGLKFGRLDFIIGGNQPQFLEVNPTGQFGWLDDKKFTLHNEVLDAILDDSSTISL